MSLSTSQLVHNRKWKPEVYFPQRSPNPKYPQVKEDKKLWSPVQKVERGWARQVGLCPISCNSYRLYFDVDNSA